MATYGAHSRGHTMNADFSHCSIGQADFRHILGPQITHTHDSAKKYLSAIYSATYNVAELPQISKLATKHLQDYLQHLNDANVTIHVDHKLRQTLPFSPAWPNQVADQSQTLLGSETHLDTALNTPLEKHCRFLSIFEKIHCEDMLSLLRLSLSRLNIPYNSSLQSHQDNIEPSQQHAFIASNKESMEHYRSGEKPKRSSRLKVKNATEDVPWTDSFLTRSNETTFIKHISSFLQSTYNCSELYNLGNLKDESLSERQNHLIRTRAFIQFCVFALQEVNEILNDSEDAEGQLMEACKWLEVCLVCLSLINRKCSLKLLTDIMANRNSPSDKHRSLIQLLNSIPENTSEQDLPPSHNRTADDHSRFLDSSRLEDLQIFNAISVGENAPIWPKAPQAFVQNTSGFKMLELPLMTVHRICSLQAPRSLARYFYPDARNLPRNSGTVRCICNSSLDQETLRSRIDDISASLITYLSLSTKCSICKTLEHNMCLADRLYLHCSSSEKSHENHICICCRLILAEPLQHVERIVGLKIYDVCPAIANDPSKAPKKKSFTFCCSFTHRELNQLRDQEIQLQIRGLESAEKSLVHIKFASEVTFRVLKKDKTITLASLKYPGPHSTRKDTPCVVPADLFCFDTPTIQVTVDCSYNTPTDVRTGILACVLARPRQLAEIFATCLKYNILCLTDSKALNKLIINHQFKNISQSEDDIIVEHQNSNIVSLRCPSTLMRIEEPARGLQCMHLQCFDLNFYLYSQTRMLPHKNRWKCPCCYRSAYLHELFIDSYTKSILDATDASERTVMISANADVLEWEPIRQTHDMTRAQNIADSRATHVTAITNGTVSKASRGSHEEYIDLD